MKIKNLRKPILSIVVLTVAALACFVSPTLAQKKKPRTPKTREITVYVYQRPDGGLYGKIIPVRRRIRDHQPLSQALKLLLKGATDEESKRNLESFIFELDFVFARVVKGTAQIHFKFQNPEIALESWEGGGFDRENFKRAVEQAARQFPGVRRVSICIGGKQGYIEEDINPPVKCPFK